MMLQSRCEGSRSSSWVCASVCVADLQSGSPRCSQPRLAAALSSSLASISQRLSSGALWSLFDLAVLTAPGLLGAPADVFTASRRPLLLREPDRLSALDESRDAEASVSELPGRSGGTCTRGGSTWLNHGNVSSAVSPTS